MSSAPKRFDAVQMMRAVRDDLSHQIKGMSLEEELDWLARQELADPLLRRLREKAAQRAVVSWSVGTSPALSGRRVLNER